jgi:hypothetical protein
VSWQFEDVKDAIALRIYRARSAQAYQAWIGGSAAGRRRDRRGGARSGGCRGRRPPSPVVHADGAPPTAEAR